MPRAMLRPLRWRRAIVRRSVPPAAVRAPGNFLTTLFGGNAVQRIRMAFGADPDGDPALWQFVDVTRYFLREGGSVKIRIGYSAGAASLQPALMDGTLRNDQAGGGDWTLGNPYSPLHPYVRENTPVIADLDVGYGPSVRFQGYTTKLKPTRSAGGALNLVTFQARGASWRLRKYDDARSPMWRFHMQSYRFPTSTNAGWPDADQGYHQLPTHYWPLEEGSGAIRGANEISLAYPLLADGPTRVPNFGGDGTLPGVKTMCRFGDGTALSVTFPIVRPGGRLDTFESGTEAGIRTQLLIRLDEGTQSTLSSKLGSLADGVTCRILTVKTAFPSVDVQQVVVWMDHDATDGLLMYADALKHDGTSVTGSVLGGEVGLPWDQGVYLTVDVVSLLGGTTEVRFGWMPLSISPTDAFPESGHVGAYDLQTVPSTFQGITGYELAEFANAGGMSMGQLSTYNGDDDTSAERYPHALLGRSGDTVAERLYRLGVMQNVPIDVIGDATDIIMGPMGRTGFADLLDECARVDLGLLVDGLGPGYTYIARQEIYSRAADLALPAADRLGADDPDHSDAGRVNIYTASSGAGSTQTFEQVDGDLGTDSIGAAPASGQHRAAFDTDLYQIAAWKVGVGTTGGLTWTGARFNLAKPSTSVLAQRWLEMLPGRRLTVLDALPGFPDPDHDAVLLGWSETWDRTSYETTVNTAPYGPYAVTVLAADSGTDSEYLGWLDTDGATIDATVLPAECLHDGFESGVAAWAAQNSWTFAQDTAQVRTGSYAVKLTPPGATASGGIATAAGTPCTGGVTYLVEAWFYSVAGWSDCRAAVDWYDASNVFISSSLGSATVVGAAAWTVSRQTFTAPANATTGRPRARQGGTPAASDVLWVDDITFMPYVRLVTPSGPIATHDALSTYADDLDGLWVTVDGIPVRVLGISGTSSPQTLVFDPTGLQRALPAGSSVVARDPVTLGL